MESSQARYNIMLTFHVRFNHSNMAYLRNAHIRPGTAWHKAPCTCVVLVIYHNLLKICQWDDELRWLPKERSGHIFGSCDISFKNMLTSHTASLALFACVCSDSAIHFLSYMLADALTENGVCFHSLVHPLAHCCFFGTACLA